MFASDKLSFEKLPANSIYKKEVHYKDPTTCFVFTWEIWEDECYIVTGHVIAQIARYACEVASPQAAAPVLAFTKTSVILFVILLTITSQFSMVVKTDLPQVVWSGSKVMRQFIIEQ